MDRSSRLIGCNLTPEAPARAKAHHLHRSSSSSQHKLTPAGMHEIDVNLRARANQASCPRDDRVERQALLTRICTELDAAPVQHLVKVLTLWRPTPEPAAVAPKSSGKATRRAADPGRSKARDGDTQRARADSGKRPPRMLKPASARFGSQRKPGSRGAPAASVAPAARSQRAAGGRRATFEPDPVARRRKPGAQGDEKGAFALGPLARRRNAGARTDRRAPHATEPIARRRRAKRQ